jgi:hypothetical protein
MRNLIFIIICLVNLTTSAQTKFEKVVPRQGTALLNCVIPLADGGYATMGQSTYGSGDKWLVRTNSNGDTLWTKSFPGIGDDWGSKHYLAETADGGLTFLSDSSYTVILTHVDSDGNRVWTRKISGGVGTSMATVTGGYVITGQDSGYSSSTSITIWKVLNNGEVVWMRSYKMQPLPPNLWPNAQDIRETKNGGYIIGGFEQGYWNYPFLFRIGPSGDSLWYKEYYSFNTSIHSVDTTADGGFTICGFNVVNNVGHAIAIKADSNGNQLWTNISYTSGERYFSSVVSTADSGAIFCGGRDTVVMGQVSTNAYLVKISSDGNNVWEKKISTLGNSNAYCIEPANDHGYIICGKVQLYDTTQLGGGLLIKTDANGNVTGTKEIETVQDYQIFPNPVNDHLTIRFPEQKFSSRTITIYDLFGQDVFKTKVYAGQSQVTVTAAAWKPGLYLYVIHDGSGYITGKISKVN